MLNSNSYFNRSSTNLMCYPSLCSQLYRELVIFSLFSTALISLAFLFYCFLLYLLIKNHVEGTQILTTFLMVKHLAVKEPCFKWKYHFSFSKHSYKKCRIQNWKLKLGYPLPASLNIFYKCIVIIFISGFALKLFAV